ncbi:MAG TPA: cysteine--tRNA ligase [Candidatus Paceibacterota bacterium]|nr:cysteine--tRNA ligase [Candidatus Paceibacterota bacterium]
MAILDFLFRKKPELPPLQFRNTLSGNIEDFSSLTSGKVLMYNCGPTPYDRQHIGNMVPPILADIIRRTLEVWGYKTRQVMNITDFGHLSGDNEGNPDVGDDKMTSGLKREGLKFTMANMRKLAEKYAALFFEDVEILGIKTKSITYPRASDYIKEQIALVKTLEEKGYAYKIDDGVYFDTSKFRDYGKLGNINLENQREGARVEGSSEKRSSHDFVLWKSSKELGWPSPWGKGFPGWHIECTAMIFTLLGKQIDIHTGGIEHIPIHHNNEIAQAEAASGRKPFVKYWLHNAHITIEGKKISKSLGNTVYLHNIVDRGHNPRAFRYWYLTGHYRTPMNFTWETIAGADQALRRLSRTYLELPGGGTPHKPFLDIFYAHVARDLDTPGALAEIWQLIKNDGIYKNVSPADTRASLAEADRILGLGLTEARPSATLKIVEADELPSEMQKLLKAREEARKTKDFSTADTIRKQIEEQGFEIKDTAQGPEITKK